MPIIMHVFVNYAHFSKKKKKLQKSLYYLHLNSYIMQHRIKWQTNLRCLHLETLRVHALSDKLGNSSWVTELVMRIG